MERISAATPAATPGDLESEGAAADEIAGDQDEVWRQGVDLGDHFLEEPGFGELLQVDIAHLDDAEVLEAVGEIADGDGEAGDFELVARVGSGVGGDAEACSCEGGTKEAAACEVDEILVGRWAWNLDAYSMIAGKAR